MVNTGFITVAQGKVRTRDPRYVSFTDQRIAVTRFFNALGGSAPADSSLFNHHPDLTKLKTYLQRADRPKLDGFALEQALLRITSAINRENKWAFILALAVIPIPRKSPKLAEIGKVLSDTIRTDQRPVNVAAAAQVVLSIKNIFSVEFKKVIRQEAKEALVRFQKQPRSPFDNEESARQLLTTICDLDAIITNVTFVPKAKVKPPKPTPGDLY